MPNRVARVVAYILLAIAATWPLASHLTTHAPGTNVWPGGGLVFETPINLWNLWWFRFALVDLHQSPFTCAYIFYPHGADLWLHTLSPLPALAGIALQTVLGLTATFNVLVLASFVCSGIAASAVARHLGLSPSAAFVAGAIYAFSPAVTSHLYAGHFELLWTCWMPLALLQFLELTDRRDDVGGPHWRHAIGLALTIAAAAYTSAYYAVYSVELLAVAAIVRWRRVLTPRVFLRLAAATILAAVLVTPLAMHLAGAGSDISAADVRSDIRIHSLEPLSLVTPSFAHPVLGPAALPLERRLLGQLSVPQETTGALGLTAIALIVLFASRRRQVAGSILSPANGWLAVSIAVVFVLLSFGSPLKWLGHATHLSLPTAWLGDVPIVRMARAPGRQVIVAMLGVAVLAAAGWQSIRGRRWRVATLSSLAFEYCAVPFPLFAVERPAAYVRLAQAQDDFAVLDVPTGFRDGIGVRGQPDSGDQLGQTVHRHPIVTGMVSRLPQAAWTNVASAPLISTLIDPAHAELPVPAEAQAYFERMRIRAIVIHPQASAHERNIVETTLRIVRRDLVGDRTEVWWLW